MKYKNYKIRGYKSLESGILLEEGREWIVLKDNPVDFAIDGFQLIRRKFIVREESTTYDPIIEKVLQLKKINLSKPVNLKLTDELLFKYFLESKSLIQIYQSRQFSALVGQVQSLKKGSFRMRLVSAKGKRLEEFDLKNDTIKIINFDSDYLKSLQLYLESIEL